jgi:hypothetical protein
MKSLKTAALGKFRTGEALQFMTTVSDVYHKFEPKNPLLDARFKELDSEVQIMRDLFMENKKESVNAKLRPLDKKRIKTLRGIKRFLLAEIDRDHPERVSHAETLLTSYDQYCAGISKLTLQHKTAIISKLLTSWSSEENLINALKALDANHWYTELATQNDVFYANYFDKARTKAAIVQSEILRNNIKEIYTKLVMDINSLVWVSRDNNVYDSLVNELNNVIDTNNQPVQSRRGKRKKVTSVMTALPVPYMVS